MNTLIPVHFTDNYLINPANPITVNLIGAGGTGSNMLMALSKMSHSLIALGHPGLQVYLYDDDLVSEANRGRQLFAECELGLSKSVALINRVNRFYGSNWKAVPSRYSQNLLYSSPHKGKANITISCVDSVVSRMEIAKILKEGSSDNHYQTDKPLYWMDFGNSRHTGQVILSTVGNIKQPASEKFLPVSNLPMVTDEFKYLLEQAESEDDTPSCSLAEALTKQDLFINSTLANHGASLLWPLFREGMLFNRGVFLNLKDCRVQPLKIA